MATKTTKKTKPKGEKPVGEVTHYYTNLGVGIIKVKTGLKAGDKVKFKGHTTDFDQIIDSMELDHKAIESAKKGDEIGVKTKDHVREGDMVYMAK